MIISTSLRCCLLAALGLLCCIASPATAEDLRLEAALAEGGKAVISFAAQPLVTMTEIPFSIELFDATGVSIRKAALEIDLTMPFMPMPPNHPAATWSEGAYRGSAIFTMAGAWQVNVSIKRPDTAEQQVSFEIEMVVMK